MELLGVRQPFSLFQEEKYQMLELNQRLESYLGRVKLLEEENKLLREEIHTLKRSREPPGQCKAQEEALKKTRRMKEKAWQEKDHVEMEVENLIEDIHMVNIQRQKEKTAQAEAQRRLVESKKELEEERRAQIWLREKVSQLEKDLLLQMQVHQENMETLQASLKQTKQVLMAPRPIQTTSIPDLEKEYSHRAAQAWKEATDNYQRQVGRLEESLNQAKTNMAKIHEEKRESQNQLQHLAKELESTKMKREMLEKHVVQQREEQRQDLQHLQAQVDALEMEKEILGQETDSLMIDRQNLLQVKMSLGLEVATYRALLDSEGLRINKPTSKTHSTFPLDALLKPTGTLPTSKPTAAASHFSSIVSTSHRSISSSQTLLSNATPTWTPTRGTPQRTPTRSSVTDEKGVEISEGTEKAAQKSVDHLCQKNDPKVMALTTPTDTVADSVTAEPELKREHIKIQKESEMKHSQIHQPITFKSKESALISVLTTEQPSSLFQTPETESWAGPFPKTAEVSEEDKDEDTDVCVELAQISHAPTVACEGNITEAEYNKEDASGPFPEPAEVLEEGKDKDTEVLVEMTQISYAPTVACEGNITEAEDNKEDATGSFPEPAEVLEEGKDEDTDVCVELAQISHAPTVACEGNITEAEDNKEDASGLFPEPAEVSEEGKDEDTEVCVEMTQTSHVPTDACEGNITEAEDNKEDASGPFTEPAEVSEEGKDEDTEVCVEMAQISYAPTVACEGNKTEAEDENKEIAGPFTEPAEILEEGKDEDTEVLVEMAQISHAATVACEANKTEAEDNKEDATGSFPEPAEVLEEGKDEDTEVCVGMAQISYAPTVACEGNITEAEDNKEDASGPFTEPAEVSEEGKDEDTEVSVEMDRISHAPEVPWEGNKPEAEDDTSEMDVRSENTSETQMIGYEDVEGYKPLTSSTQISENINILASSMQEQGTLYAVDGFGYKEESNEDLMRVDEQDNVSNISEDMTELMKSETEAVIDSIIEWDRQEDHEEQNEMKVMRPDAEVEEQGQTSTDNDMKGKNETEHENVTKRENEEIEAIKIDIDGGLLQTERKTIDSPKKLDHKESLEDTEPPAETCFQTLNKDHPLPEEDEGEEENQEDEDDSLNISALCRTDPGECDSYTQENTLADTRSLIHYKSDGETDMNAQASHFGVGETSDSEDEKERMDGGRWSESISKHFNTMEDLSEEPDMDEIGEMITEETVEEALDNDREDMIIQRGHDSSEDHEDLVVDVVEGESERTDLEGNQKEEMKDDVKDDDYGLNEQKENSHSEEPQILHTEQGISEAEDNKEDASGPFTEPAEVSEEGKDEDTEVCVEMAQISHVPTVACEENISEQSNQKEEETVNSYASQENVNITLADHPSSFPDVPFPETSQEVQALNEVSLSMFQNSTTIKEQILQEETIQNISMHTNMDFTESLSLESEINSQPDDNMPSSDQEECNSSEDESPNASQYFQNPIPSATASDNDQTITLGAQFSNDGVSKADSASSNVPEQVFSTDFMQKCTEDHRTSQIDDWENFNICASTPAATEITHTSMDAGLGQLFPKHETENLDSPNRIPGVAENIFGDFEEHLENTKESFSTKVSNMMDIFQRDNPEEKEFPAKEKESEIHSFFSASLKEDFWSDGKLEMAATYDPVKMEDFPHDPIHLNQGMVLGEEWRDLRVMATANGNPKEEMEILKGKSQEEMLRHKDEQSRQAEMIQSDESIDDGDSWSSGDV